MDRSTVAVIGGGLAGSEAALHLAACGHRVDLYEMRPATSSPAHHTGELAELVCSNSLKGQDPSSAAGLLKEELTALGCRLLAVARSVSVPAGGALAVDRQAFSRAVTAEITANPSIRLVRRELSGLPDADHVVVATGPLTSPRFEESLTALVGPERLAFFDAAAPIVDAQTIDMDRVFTASRYGKGGGADYLNCPMTEPEYRAFHSALVQAERVTQQDFESRDLFAACMPVEEVARRGADALTFGMMKPVGLVDPRTDSRPFAVVQLRAETQARTAYNLVGFQTNLRFGDQDTVFRMIPGLQRAEFLRHGVMHRNTFVDSPALLDPGLTLRTDRLVSFAGQIIGTEGYVEAMATGMLAAANADARLRGEPLVRMPTTTALGSLIAYATDPATERYQPMHVNFGLVPPLTPPVSGKRRRYAAYAERARADLREWLVEHPGLSRPAAGASHE